MVIVIIINLQSVCQFTWKHIFRKFSIDLHTRVLFETLSYQINHNKYLYNSFFLMTRVIFNTKFSFQYLTLDNSKDGCIIDEFKGD